MKTVGSRAQVMHGTCIKTSGGLKIDDLMYNKSGSIVSKTKSQLAKTENRLERAGYFCEKGKFGSVKKE